MLLVEAYYRCKPGSYFITIYNAEVNEEWTAISREFVKRAIN